MVNSVEFGNRLQEILDFYTISATEFSNKISVNRSTISHLLSGRNKPSLDFVMKVLHKFPEVELYWLLNGKGIFPFYKKEELSPIKNSLETDLFNSEGNISASKTTPSVLQENINSSISEKIERIVIFYKDGRFKEYKN